MHDLSESNDPNEINDPNRGSNWQHYTEALQLYHEFMNHHFSEALRTHRERNREQYVRPEQVQPMEENQNLPVDGYLSLYCDLLGFSSEIVRSGTDSLPDYYGAAFVSAKANPNVQVYLLSDSCIAFAPKNQAGNLLNFMSTAVGNWVAEGMLPQCFIGYGSFAERRPLSELAPDNFFGVQITGTALVDAVNIQKKTKPLGSRMLISESATNHLPEDFRLATDGQGNVEMLWDRPKQFHLHDCIYYLLCLRGQKPGTRAFGHYIWSAASRAFGGGDWVLSAARNLARPHFDERRFEEISGLMDHVLESYQSIRAE